jgi:DMSO reductase anchor subunit
MGDAAMLMRMLRIKLEFMSSCVACVFAYCIAFRCVCVCVRARATDPTYQAVVVRARVVAGELVMRVSTFWVHQAHDPGLTLRESWCEPF